MLIEVTGDPAGRGARGWLVYGGLRVPCALGRAGIRADKREGDGATPAGTFELRRVLYRADRVDPPDTRLPLRAIAPNDGWCDDPAHEAYNRPVQFPFAASAEALWRDDGIYDLVAVLGHNDDPPLPGRGSAIFLHAARAGLMPTEGCVALARDDLIDLLDLTGPGDSLRVVAPEGR